MRRLIAIGDIHGQYEMLLELIAKIAPQSDDQLVFLGDYIDRGPNSPAVLDWLISFKQQWPQTIVLRGNHEQMLLDAVISAEEKLNGRTNWLNDVFALRSNGLPAPIYYFIACGGRETIIAYNPLLRDSDLCEELTKIPTAHLGFIRQTDFYYTYGKYMFVHASVDPKNIFGTKDNNRTFLWERAPLWKADKSWSKVVVHGHTPVEKPYFNDSEINLDTGAGYNGKLTACDVKTQQVWQVSHCGK